MIVFDFQKVEIDMKVVNILNTGCIQSCIYRGHAAKIFMTCVFMDNKCLLFASEYTLPYYIEKKKNIDRHR